MNFVILTLLVMIALPSRAQIGSQNITAAQLQTLLDLPLDQALQQRAAHKEPLIAAYNRRFAPAGKDCETVQQQQPYNVCIGQADQEADKDYAIFYNNLQWLCHDQEQLKTLQGSESNWTNYRESAMRAARAAWPNGTGAPGFVGGVYLSLVRDYMRELHEIYSLNISQ